MATEELKITIEEKNALKEKVQKYQDFTSSVPMNDKTRSKIDTHFTQAFSELGYDKLRKSNLRSVQQHIASITSIMTSLNTVSDTTTKDLEKFQKVIASLDEELSRLKKRRNDILKTGLVKNKDGSLQIRQSEGIRTIKNKHFKGNNGEELSETAIKNYISGKSGLPSKFQGLGLEEKIQQALRGRQTNLINEYQNIDQQIPEKEKNLEQATEQIKTLEIGDATIAAQAVDLKLQTNQAIQNLKDKFDAQEVADTKDTETGVQIESLNTGAEKQQQLKVSKLAKEFSLYALGLRTLKKGIKEAINTFTSLDQSLTEQAMVTGKTRTETYNLLKTYQSMSAQLGATTKEVANVATEYMRQGKTVQESLTLTTAAISAAKVANISASDSINYLTTALNGFQLSTSNAMTVSDKFAAVAASSATDYEELAVALSKVASQANLAGMSIDYTTALLAKGIETTREAPETIGTALKTVIARMREISDYGETLEGDTDVNNVESQLAYVGIALRTTEGELRSTEDVLDELGKKWDTLNSNQQAAIAKALAGTRQQSRLISMMTDYERVIELQKIAEESSGATVAQMSTYLQGMESAINRVQVAWESITTSLTDNEVIIDLTNSVANLINGFSDVISNTGLLKTALAGLLIITGSIVSNKLQLVAQQKASNQIEKANQKLEQKSLLIQAKQVQQAWKKTQADAESVKLKAEEKGNTVLAAKAQETLNKSTQSIAESEATITQEAANLQKATADNITNLTSQETSYANIASTVGILGTGIAAIGTGINGWTIGLTAAFALLKAAPPLIGAVKTAMKGLTTVTQAQGAAATAAAFAAKALPWIAAGLLAISGVAGIASAIGKAQEGTSDTTKVNDLSNFIYNTTQTNQSIKSTLNSYDELDKKIIKTKADQEEMNSLLEEMGEKLSEDQQKTFNNYSTNAQKRAYLEKIYEDNQTELSSDRKEQLEIINNSKNRNEILDTTTTNQDYLNVQSAIYATANSYIYEYVGNLEDAQDGVKDLAQELIGNLSPALALTFANTPAKIESLVKTLNNLKLTINDVDTSVADVLTSDDYNISDKVTAYNKLLSTITDLDIKTSIQEVYSDIATFSKFSDTALEYVDKYSLSADGINTFSKSLTKLGYSTKEITNNLEDLFTLLESGTSISDAVVSIFGTENYDGVITAVSNLIGTTTLQIGQNITAFKNKIDNFYTAASEWNDKTDTEKTEFISSNSELFKGESGEKLLEAMNSGDFETIRQALAANETLQKQVQSRIQELETNIAIEEAKTEENRDYAALSYYKEQLKFFKDTENLYSADIETRREQEQKYLEEYKSYLEDQRDALKDSLEDRKDAYQDYFDTVNQDLEDEDFEEQESTLIANLSKLATSTSADSISQAADLTDQLEDLEKERIKTLRERAQEQVISNIEDTISDIDKKFDDLLNSEQAILQIMSTEMQDPAQFIGNLMSNKITEEGLTKTGLESYIQTLSSTYSPLLGSDIFKNMSIEQNGETFILNVNGTKIALDSTKQETLADAIAKALTSVGIR